jgi:hypothetical protein
MRQDEPLRLFPIPARSFRPKRYKPGNVGNWSGHLAFVSDLIGALTPSTIVELGTHYGESYFGMCQAVEEHGLRCRCFAVDTWQGDQHAGLYSASVFDEVNDYNDRHYAAFSRLLRMTFAEAQPQFADSSIDLLHIDGLHTYEAVRADFTSWWPKIRPGGVVLLHDISATHADFEVWKLWEELRGEFQCFEFLHSWGLGVLQKPGASAERNPLAGLLAASPNEQHLVRLYYVAQAELLELRNDAAERAKPLPYTYFQVFPHLDHGIEESTSVLVPIEPGGWHDVALTLPRGSGHGRIRIDPAHRPCVVQIESLAVRRSEGALLGAWRTKEELAELEPIGDLVRVDMGDHLTLLSTGHDPRLLLPELDKQLLDQALVIESRVRVDHNISAAVSALCNSSTTAARISIQAPLAAGSVESEPTG